MKAQKLFIGLLMACVLINGCKKKDDDQNPVMGSGDKAKYVFVAYSIGAAGESAPYIITSDDVTGGTVDLSNGVETDAYSFIPQNNRLFAAVWGSQGPITPYTLDINGDVIKTGYTVNAPTAAIYGPVNNNEWIGGGFTGDKESPHAPIFRYDAEEMILAQQTTINMSVAAVENEWPTWYGVFQVDNDKLYIPYELSPSNGDTKYPDSTWIMVINYPDLTFNKIIRDGRSGAIGSWFGMEGIRQFDNGDVYAWSSAVNSKNPSAIMRIKRGADQFDQSYFFNIEEKTGGLKISRADYLGGNKLLASIFTSAEEAKAWNGKTRMAIIDVVSQTITYINDIPEHPQMSYKQKVYVETDGKTAHYVMADNSKRLFVYNIDVETAQAKRGLEFVNIADVTTISKIRY